HDPLLGRRAQHVQDAPRLDEASVLLALGNAKGNLVRRAGYGVRSQSFDAATDTLDLRVDQSGVAGEVQLSLLVGHVDRRVDVVADLDGDLGFAVLVGLDRVGAVVPPAVGRAGSTPGTRTVTVSPRAPRKSSYPRLVMRLGRTISPSSTAAACAASFS